MPGNASGAAKAREARARKLEERRRREVEEQAVAMGLLQQPAQQPPEPGAPPDRKLDQPAASVPAAVAPTGVVGPVVNPVSVAAQQLEHGTVEAAVLLRRLVRGDVRATPQTRKDAAVSILTMNGFGKQEDPGGLRTLRGPDAEAFMERVAKAFEFERRRRDAVTIDPATGQPQNPPKT